MLMTADEFRAYAHEALSPEALEPLHEQIAEHNGEVARFGDSGPGRLRQLHDSVREVHRIERQLARLEGREPRRFTFNIKSPR